MHYIHFNRSLRQFLLALLFSAIFFCIYSEASAASSHEKATALALEKAALQRIGKTLFYDGSYQKMSYPMGDVEDERGVCTDVIIRSYRKLGIDLQELVHQDMKSDFSMYPNHWDLSKPDPNIDHRRVPNLRRFFERKAESFTVSSNPENYQVGDIVSWVLPNNLPHIGIVVSHKSVDGERPLIVHNIGGGTALDDFLFVFEITGHYRYLPEASILSE